MDTDIHWARAAAWRYRNTETPATEAVLAYVPPGWTLHVPAIRRPGSVAACFASGACVRGPHGLL